MPICLGSCGRSLQVLIKAGVSIQEDLERVTVGTPWDRVCVEIP